MTLYLSHITPFQLYKYSNICTSSCLNIHKPAKTVVSNEGVGLVRPSGSIINEIWFEAK